MSSDETSLSSQLHELQVEKYDRHKSLVPKTTSLRSPGISSKNYLFETTFKLLWIPRMTSFGWPFMSFKKKFVSATFMISESKKLFYSSPVTCHKLIYLGRSENDFTVLSCHELREQLHGAHLSWVPSITSWSSPVMSSENDFIGLTQTAL
jgi:hypothetical protein